MKFDFDEICLIYDAISEYKPYNRSDGDEKLIEKIKAKLADRCEPAIKLPRFEVVVDIYAREYRIFDNERYAIVSHFSMDYYSIEDVQTEGYRLTIKK